VSNKFAFGIIDKNGNPYLKTGAISTEREPLEQAVEFMNATANLGGNQHLVPFEVVDLIWTELPTVAVPRITLLNMLARMESDYNSVRYLDDIEQIRELLREVE
jgi:hypothetical protein